MPAPKNAPIGTCPCPFKGCETVTDVFKFRGRSDNPSRHRYAGRLYCVCPTHGRIESQEWILANARIETTGAAPVAPVPDHSPAITPAPVAPVKPRPAAPARAPVPSSSPATERAQVRWGFFD